MIDPKTVKSAIADIKSTNDEKALERLRLKYLGRKGVITAELKAIGQLPPAERAKAGAFANLARHELEAALAAAVREARAQTLERSAEQPIDLTAPVAAAGGHLHPVTAIQDELVRIFWQMGFEVADGPEIETDWYNFEALNLPPEHPARDMQDTFYLEKANLPRTHTSSVQVRYMESHRPPIRIVCPGKVYRNEDEDARHIWMFHQIEGLVVDENISIADLKGTVLAMLQGLIGPSAKVRLRPNFFPYTEPSIEFDASCVVCKGAGCNTCSGTGWIELGGSGMVHPQVLRNVNIDPEVYSGFAFGFGIERLAAVKYGVPDLREFWRPSLPFLEQF